MRPFQFVRIDYLGPIVTLTNDNEVYILLFTCMQVQAIHLEVTLSLAYTEFCSAFPGLFHEEAFLLKFAQTTHRHLNRLLVKSHCLRIWFGNLTVKELRGKVAAGKD